MNGKKMFIAGILAFAVLLVLNYIEVKFDSISLVLSGSISLLCGFLLYIMLSFSKIADRKQDTEAFHPGVFAVFALLSAYRPIYFYANNITMVPFFFALIFIMAYAALFFIIFYFLKLIFKDKNDALVLSLIFTGLLSININNTGYLPSYFGGTVLLCIAVLTFFNRAKIVEFLKPFAITLLAICFLNGGYNILGMFYTPTRPFKANGEFKITKAPNRDIYIILLDEYGGKRGLQHIGYDNSEFINELKKRGFKTYENIESNYQITMVSLSSFLNAEYISNLAFKSQSEAISNAKIFRVAKQAGYRIYYINSWPLEITIKEGVVDQSYSSLYSNKEDVVKLFLDKTPLAPIAELFKGDYSKKSFDTILDYTYNVIDKKEAKKLVFAHLLMPHYPYVYDEYGNNNPYKYVGHAKNSGFVLNEKAYLAFLKYANKETLKIVDRIFKNAEGSGKMPIIIVTGDHGIRTIFYEHRSKQAAIKKNCKYCFNTFLAYYNPDVKQEEPKEKSLINFYINFMNDNFGTDFKNKEDEHYYVFPHYKNFSSMEVIRTEY